MAVDAGIPLVAVHEDRESVTEQDAAAMLRDLAEAVTEVAERMFDLPEEDARCRSE